MNYALIGYGRMGQAIEREAAARGHRRVAVVDPGQGSTPLASVRAPEVQLAFEFTTGPAAEANTIALLGAGVAVVCGTTGWEPSAALVRATAAGPAAALIAPNFSLGVNLFFRLVERAARDFVAAGGFDPFVHEAHHRHKLDAPSGTARRLTALLAAVEPGRGGRIDVSSTRAGAEPGRHVVGFDGPHDLITIEHRARGRQGFAAGAVVGAEWLLDQPPGMYTFEAVLRAILPAAGTPGGEAR